MKITVPVYSIETLIFTFLLLLTVFNDEKYGTVFGKVFIFILLFIAFASIKRNALKRTKKNMIYGTIWCLSFLFSTLIFYGNGFVEGQTFFVICIFIIFYCVFLGVKLDNRQIRFILAVYFFGGIFMSINIIRNYLAKNYYVNKRASFEVFGVYKDPNYVAALIVPIVFIVTMSIFNKKNKIRQMIVLVVIDIGLILAIQFTGSRAAFVAIVLAVGVYIALQLLDTSIKTTYKLFLMILVIIGVIAFSVFLLSSTNRLTDFSAYENNIRLIIWSDALNFWSKSPIIGNGAAATSNYTMTCWYRYATHNCFFDMFGDSGILGVFCFANILLDVIKKASDRKKVIAFATVCMIPQAFINGFYTFNFWLVLCLIKLYSDYIREEKTEALSKERRI